MRSFASSVFSSRRSLRYPDRSSILPIAIETVSVLAVSARPAMRSRKARSEVTARFPSLPSSTANTSLAQRERAELTSARPAASSGGASQPSVLPIAVLLDDGGRRVENDLRRAIVLLEPDDLRAAEVRFEIQDVPEVRAAPLVDRLVGIADDGDVPVDPGEMFDQQVLRPV